MIVAGTLLALAGCIAAAFGLYLVLLAFASFFYSQTIEGFSPQSRLDVLIPAHDEELLVGRTVRSLLAQSYPRALFRIVVIADNCSDETAAVAASAGADVVMVRDAPDARGKGRALRWAIDQLLAADSPPDAFVSVDADTITDADLLCALVERFEAGAEAVQWRLPRDRRRIRSVCAPGSRVLSVQLGATQPDPACSGGRRGSWATDGCSRPRRCADSRGRHSQALRIANTALISSGTGCASHSPDEPLYTRLRRPIIGRRKPSSCDGRADGQVWCVHGCQDC